MGYEEEKHPTGPILPEPVKSMVSPIDETGQPVPTPPELPSGLQAFDMKRLVALSIVIIGIIGIIAINVFNIPISLESMSMGMEAQDVGVQVEEGPGPRSVDSPVSTEPLEGLPDIYREGA